MWKFTSLSFATCVYICVVDKLWWPNNICTALRSAPWLSKWVAKACLREWGDIFLPGITFFAYLVIIAQQNFLVIGVPFLCKKIRLLFCDITESILVSLINFKYQSFALSPRGIILSLSPLPTILMRPLSMLIWLKFKETSSETLNPVA